MNDALAITRGFEVPSFVEALKSFAEQFAFLRTPAKKSAKQICGPDDLLGPACAILDQIIVGAIEKRTVAEFAAYRLKVLPDYIKASRAIGDLARLSISHEVRKRIIAESFGKAETNFKEHGAIFGSVVRDQAIFTLWTFKKIDSVIKDVLENLEKVPEQQRKVDSDLASDFGAYVTWTRFHLDCLMVSLRTHKPIYPEVRDDVANGLRAAVNAYACVKRAAKLRAPVVEPLVQRAEWDDEDRELLSASMRDMEREVID
jgi:hypothetical protein